MGLSPEKYFKIGGLLIGAGITIAGFVVPGTEGALVAQIGGVVAGTYAGIGLIVFGPQTAANETIQNISNPAIQSQVAQALTTQSGVSVGVDRAKATPELVALAASRAPENQKIDFKTTP